MDFKRLSSRAKDLVDKRGGTESLKQDAEQLREIAKGSGSLGDKAKAAVGAIKDPGGASGTASAAEAASEPEVARAEEKVEGEHRGKHAGGGHGRGGHGRGGKGRGRGERAGRGGQDAV